MQSEDILQPEKFTLLFPVPWDAREIAGLHARIVAYGHLLLLEDLARIDKFLDGPSSK